MKANIGKPDNKPSKHECGIRKTSLWCPCWDSFPSDVFKISTSVIPLLAYYATIKKFKKLLYLEFLRCFSHENRGF